MESAGEEALVRIRIGHGLTGSLLLRNATETGHGTVDVIGCQRVPHMLSPLLSLHYRKIFANVARPSERPFFFT